VSSRNSILANVARNQPEQLPLPILPATSRPNLNLITTFQNRAEAIGGQVVPVPQLSTVSDYLRRQFGPAALGVHNVPGLDYGTWLSASVSDTHSFALVDWAVLTGEFGVAENGAVWIDTQTLPNRALPFICQHLALVISESSLIPTMHEAYRRLDGNRFDYGVFIAGPSKTADIEQSLVIGAHGARSLIVFLLADN
jgi:L-lactate dehydrogenase complex protein LldG